MMCCMRGIGPIQEGITGFSELKLKENLMKRIKRFINVLLLIVVTIVLWEIIGQNILFKDKLYFIDNVDHHFFSPQGIGNGCVC